VSAGPVEVLGLDQSIAYAQHLAAEAGLHGPDGNEGYLTRLTAAHVVGAGLATGHDMQQAFAAAASAATGHAAELGKQKAVQEQYDANPDAGDKAYQTGGDGGGTAVAPGSGDVTGIRAPSGSSSSADRADDEIPPQWPGHKPRRRWEWKVSARKPGDPRHVNYALPTVDLTSEQALRAYVQDTLRRYDGIELHHWYSGSELTFTRRPDGSVRVGRRQLNPTDGGVRRVGDGVDAVQLELTDAQLREWHQRLGLQLVLDEQDSDR
jgi:hypothetical protein